MTLIPVKGSMEIETTLGELDQQIRQLGKPMNTRVRVIIDEPQKKPLQPSKWAKFAQEEISPLHGLSDYVLSCSQEFRENFAFKHDND